MNKIGIITITRDENYGNRLQNYAVQEVIKKLGFNAETIINNTSNGFGNNALIPSFKNKLKPAYILKVAKTRIKNKLLIKNYDDGIIRSFFWKVLYNTKIKAVLQSRKDAFVKFNSNNIIFSSTIISVDNIDRADLSSYEYFICGSDQIWNPYYTQNSMIDFLYFAPKTKRIAYSPSFGVDHIPETKRELYKKWINDIPNLSVREEQGAAIIKDLTGRDAIVLVDPTLMLSKDEWMAIAKKPNIDAEKKYILTYLLGNKTKAYQKAIREMAEFYSCRVINLADIRESENYAIDPGEFVYLIKNAVLVCTDSFHGVVLSIIMHTNFIVFDRVEEGHSMSSRLETLLKKFGLKERLFRNLANYKEVLNTNFNSAEHIINLEQNKAWKFLKAATGQ